MKLVPTGDVEPVWVEPYPDGLLEQLQEFATDPERRYALHESMSLAFVAALQRLPGRQRAALLLHDVYGFGSAEVAAMLQISVAAVDGLLGPARASVDSELPDAAATPRPGSGTEREALERFVAAHEHADTPALISRLTADAVLVMSPGTRIYRGPTAIAAALRTVPVDRRLQRFRGLATRANGQPAVAWYLGDPDGVAYAFGLNVLTLRGDRICSLTAFHDTSLFARFGLPQTLARRSR